MKLHNSIFFNVHDFFYISEVKKKKVIQAVKEYLLKNLESKAKIVKDDN